MMKEAYYLLIEPSYGNWIERTKTHIILIGCDIHLNEPNQFWGYNQSILSWSQLVRICLSGWPISSNLPTHFWLIIVADKLGLSPAKLRLSWASLLSNNLIFGSAIAGWQKDQVRPKTIVIVKVSEHCHFLKMFLILANMRPEFRVLYRTGSRGITCFTFMVPKLNADTFDFF